MTEKEIYEETIKLQTRELKHKRNVVIQLQEELKEERRLPVRMNYIAFFSMLTLSSVTLIKCIALLSDILIDLL